MKDYIVSQSTITVIFYCPLKRDMNQDKWGNVCLRLVMKGKIFGHMASVPIEFILKLQVDISTIVIMKDRLEEM